MQSFTALDFPIGEAVCRLAAVNAAVSGTGRSSYYRHRHSYCELHYVAHGLSRLRVEGADVVLEAGGLCLIGPGVYHTASPLSADTEKLTMSFSLTLPEGCRPSPSCAAFLSAFPAGHAVLKADGKSAALLEEIALLAKAPRDGGRCPGFARGTAMCALTALLLLRIAAALGGSAASVSPRLVSDRENRRCVIDDFFNENFAVQNGSALLAKSLNVSRRQLERILRELYGKSYREKLAEIRLEVALEMLRSTNESISVISDLTGYSTPANFCVFMKNATGLSPSRIRADAAASAKEIQPFSPSGPADPSSQT